MQYLEGQILNWRFMAWRVFQRKTWKREEECLNKKTKVLAPEYLNNNTLHCNGTIYRLILVLLVCFLETHKKKQNQDDSDEYDDDDEPGPSFQQPAPGQPQAGYIPPMTQPGMPPGSGAPGIPPGSYSGGRLTLILTLIRLYQGHAVH